MSKVIFQNIVKALALLLVCLLGLLGCGGHPGIQPLPRPITVGDEVEILWQVSHILGGGPPYTYRVEEIDRKYLRLALKSGNQFEDLGWFNSDFIAFIKKK